MSSFKFNTMFSKSVHGKRIKFHGFGKMNKTWHIFLPVVAFLSLIAPSYGESCDKIAAEIVDFLVRNYFKEEVAAAVKNFYGQCQGEDGFVGDFRRFLPRETLVTYQGIIAPHGLPEQSSNEKIYKVYIRFTYKGRYFAYRFSAAEVSPELPLVLREVSLFETLNGSYRKIEDLK